MMAVYSLAAELLVRAVVAGEEAAGRIAPVVYSPVGKRPERQTHRTQAAHSQ